MAEGEGRKGIEKIPHDRLITEILTRLPAKSAVRCRSLCKRWRSCLEDPKFISNHAMKARENPDPDMNEKLFCVKFDLKKEESSLYRVNPETYNSLDGYHINTMVDQLLDNSEKMVLPTMINSPRKGSCSIVGSSNGLLCLTFHQFRDVQAIVLLNFVTGDKLVLRDQNLGVYRSTYGSEYGFGYDSSTNDYKIVRLLGFSTSTYPYKVEVFSLKNSSWRTIPAPAVPQHGPPNPMALRSSSSVEVGGFLHWQLLHSDNTLLAFDLARDKFVELTINVPNKHQIIGIGVLNGCLYLTCRENLQGNCVVWVMKEYGVAESLTKLVHVDLRYYFGKVSSLQMFPLLHHPMKGRLLLDPSDNGTIYNFQDDSNTAYKETPKEAIFIWNISSGVETLVSPSQFSNPL